MEGQDWRAALQGLSPEALEKRKAELSLEALRLARGLHPSARHELILALLRDEYLPGATEQHAEWDNFEALLLLLAEKAT